MQSLQYSGSLVIVKKEAKSTHRLLLKTQFLKIRVTNFVKILIKVNYYYTNPCGKLQEKKYKPAAHSLMTKKKNIEP